MLIPEQSFKNARQSLIQDKIPAMRLLGKLTMANTVQHLKHKISFHYTFIYLNYMVVINDLI